jgi:hypothetical protein
MLLMYPRVLKLNMILASIGSTMVEQLTPDAKFTGLSPGVTDTGIKYKKTVI